MVRNSRRRSSCNEPNETTLYSPSIPRWQECAGCACFIWRKFVSGDGEVGVNCAAFRNEGPGLSSELIREACTLAWARWPGERLYTYVNENKIRRKRDPGRCFIRAGWHVCGRTTGAGLIILEILPKEES